MNKIYLDIGIVKMQLKSLKSDIMCSWRSTGRVIKSETENLYEL